MNKAKSFRLVPSRLSTIRIKIWMSPIIISIIGEEGIFIFGWTIEELEPLMYPDDNISIVVTCLKQPKVIIKQ